MVARMGIEFIVRFGKQVDPVHPAISLNMSFRRHLLKPSSCFGQPVECPLALRSGCGSRRMNATLAMAFESCRGCPLRTVLRGNL